MSGMKIVRYDAKNSLQISGHGVDGVNQRDENNLAFFGVGKKEGSHAHFEERERFALGRSRRCSRRAG